MVALSALIRDGPSKSTTGGCFQTLVIDDSAFGLMPEVFGYVAFDDPEPTRVIR